MKVNELDLDLKMPEKVKTKKHGIEIIPYLTTAQIGVIVSNCITIDDVVMRNQLVDEYVLRFVADIEIETTEEYDLLKSNGVVDEIFIKVQNIPDLYDALTEANDMGNVVRTALNNLVDKIPDEKQLPKLIDKLTKKLKEITKEG